MGLYCSTTSLATIMIGTTFDSITTALAAKLITHAENEVNKYLSKRYDISAFNTSTSIPPLVTSLTETLAEAYMQRRMSRGGKEILAYAKDLIKDTTDNLKLIADYKLDLVNTAGSVIADMSQTAYRVLSSTSGYTPTFDEDDELNWSPDESKLSDIANERD